jgi:hypothetical protein
MTRLPVFGNILSEVVDYASDQGRSVFATGGVAARVEDGENVRTLAWAARCHF